MSGRLLAVVTVRLSGGGIAGYVLQNCERMGLPVDVVTIEEPGGAVRARVAGFGGTLYVLGRNRNPAAYVRALARLVRRGGYRAAWCHGNSATLAADLLGARLGGARVRIAHAHSTACNHPALHRLLRPLMNALATRRLACGEAAGRFLYGRRPFTVCHNGVDTARFRFSPALRRDMRAALGLADGARVLGTVGALSAAKDPLFAAEVFAALRRREPGVRLLVVGDGPLRGELEARLTALGVRDAAVLAGARQDVPALLDAMDAFLLPSRHEGFPLALVEALCSGLPCVAADAVAREADVTGHTAFLPRDAARWARQLLDTPPADETERRAAQGEVRAAGYDVQDTAAALARLLREEVGI